MMEVTVSCKSDNDNNILVSRIVPHHDKLNAKGTQVNIHLKNEFNKRNGFMFYGQLEQKSYNHFQNILRLFDVLSNFPFTTSEMMDDYYL